MKHKNKAQLFILLSILFNVFFSVFSAYAISPKISISFNNINLAPGESERINMVTTDFNGTITISSTNTSIATIKMLGCESAASCTVRNRSIVAVVQGLASGVSEATVSFSGTITSSGIKINETQKINIAVKDTDASVASLSVSPAPINFDKNITEYTVSVEHEVENIIISATPVSRTTTISGTGTYTLRDYLNTFEVVSTAENGASVTYKINVKRKDSNGRTAASAKKNENRTFSSDTTLNDILIPGYDIEFNNDITEYKITVNPNVESLMVKAIASNEKTKVEIEGNENIEYGENLIKIVVLAESGDAKEFLIKVVRPDDKDATLIGQDGEDGNVDVLGVSANGKGLNLLPIIISIAAIFTVVGAITTIVFLKKRADVRHKQFNVMRVNGGFRPNSMR